MLEVDRGREMTTALNADGYLAQLTSLLERCDADATDNERQTLRAIVGERRNWGPRRASTPATKAIGQRADEIMALLEDASRTLRPREAQTLDDLVAGRQAPVDSGSPYEPVRLRRRGSSSSS
jgi:hypothetical protein